MSYSLVGRTENHLKILFDNAADVVKRLFVDSKSSEDEDLEGDGSHNSWSLVR